MKPQNENVKIRRLPPDVINRIAAGEVIERPAAAIKELIENALDANARRIAVQIEAGGLKRLTVSDDGCGMSEAELCLAIERHATSKLQPSASGAVDLLNIHTMGFRGEALPSIASVSRMTITSQADGAPACEISLQAGAVTGPRPAAFTGHGKTGTRIDVRDLFYATPARLKFMKSERAEAQAISDTVKRLAMAYPEVAFELENNGRRTLAYRAEEAGDTGRLKRLGQIMGRAFHDNAIAIEAARDGIRLSGFAGLPTFNRGNAQQQYLFVNGRPVKDRMLNGVLRAAYQDFLARDRHPVAALFLELDPEQVDVNVHPAKTEVRFRDAGQVRGLIIGALRHALAAAGHRASTTVATQALGKVQAEPLQADVFRPSTLWADSAGSAYRPRSDPATEHAPLAAHSSETAYSGRPDIAAASYETTLAGRVEPVEPNADAFPLGAARAQLHETYIVSQTPDGIVIVDQHAAHERLVYEDMKRQMSAGGVKRQALLIPEIVELAGDELQRILERTEELGELGLEIEPFGHNALCVRATPALFGQMDLAGLIQDLADDLSEYDETLALRERFEDIMGNMACRGSVRAGRRLNAAEMNALLRQMEATPHSGQCNHGRPTYVELKLKDIERLFGRR